MRGHIRQQSKGSWRIMAYLPRDPVTGKQRRAARTVRGTKKDAELELAKLVLEVDRGAHGSREVTVDELLVRYLEHAQLAPYTRSNYAGVIKNYLIPRFGRVKVYKLSAADLDAYYDSLRAQLGPARIYKIHTVMRSALRQAQRWGWVATNVALQASPPPVARADVRPPDPDGVGHLLEAAEAADPALLTFVYLAAATGARKGELCGLRWGDLNRTSGQLLIARSVWAVAGEWGLKETKTNRARVVALNQPTLDVLSAHRRRCQEDALLWGMAFGDGTFLFYREGDSATPWRPDAAYHRFRRLRERAGIEGVTVHALRHYVATQLIAAGVDPVTVAGRLGHANPSTTLNMYASFQPAKDVESAEILGRLLPRRQPGSG